MAVRPTVGSVAEDLYAALGPWARRDTADERFQALEFAEAIGGRLQLVEDVARDEEVDGVLHPGWSKILDPDRAPREWLPWLAQWAGATLPSGLTEEQEREYIKNTDGFKRGTRGATLVAIRLRLTGTKTVHLTERHGSPYRVAVGVLASETPDPSGTLADFLTQKPGGLVFDFSVLPDTLDDYETLYITHSSYQHVYDAFDSYQEVYDDPSIQ